ncbi:hypothetical protein [Clostridium tetani]|uniref:Uncharacterized protein n=1 Tax=Clostridium tetani TaxID=1513 RepID=A0ABC8EGT9_CLOTA|nr:hypothetical protein [Clostridium tetani]BDR82572.1 hypothetical protein K234311028_p20550 [Clostridium tetani]
MLKEGLLKKIKFMEMALEQGEKLNMMCKPSYCGSGSFRGLELFFMSDNMTYSSILNSDNSYYVVLKHDRLSQSDKTEEWYNSLTEEINERSKWIKEQL